MAGKKPYSISRAELVADQIRRFSTQHLHQLAGHRANLDFWVAEAAAAVRSIDEYQQRFRRLRDAQTAWVKEHDTRFVHCPICRGPCDLGPQRPEPPRRVPSDDLSAARTAVRVAVRDFLLRLYRAELIGASEVEAYAASVGALVESEDLGMEPGVTQ
jgi:hypothetical protein